MKPRNRLLALAIAGVALTGCAQTASQTPGDALVPGTDFNATGLMLCSNQGSKGDPASFDCEFGVVRHGNGSATLVVTLPTGNQRSISFENGVPVSSDSPARLHHRRSGDDTHVSIGNTERYVIADAVIYGG